MTTIYEVDVQHLGQHVRTVRVAAAEAILACEHAERIVAVAREDWGNLPDYFANAVRPLDGFNMLELMSRQMG